MRSWPNSKKGLLVFQNVSEGTEENDERTEDGLSPGRDLNP
jgi:hypothetical protein